MSGRFTRFVNKVHDATHAKFDAFLAAISGKEDADRLLSYYTKQQVIFLDWKLGVTFWSIQLSMAVLIVGYVLIYAEGYMKFEEAKGATVTLVSGDALSNSIGKPATRYFSAEDLTYPGLENGNVFIASRQTVHRQMRGYCEDPDLPCSSTSDCPGHGKSVCTENNLCSMYSWCDIEDKPEIYDMAVDTVSIWTRSFIQFVKLAPGKMYTTDYNTSEPSEDNTFSVRQLLNMVKPLPVHYEEVAALGGIFEVGIRWNCGISSRKICKPDIEVRRMDTIFDPDDVGYDFSYAEYIDGDHRLNNHVRGLRFLFRTTGVGKKMSVSATIMCVSTSGTLMSLAIVVADVLLTKVFKDRNKYIARKLEHSPDFSEYIKELEEKKSKAQRLIDIEKSEQVTCEREDAWILRYEEHGIANGPRSMART